MCAVAVLFASVLVFLITCAFCVAFLDPRPIIDRAEKYESAILKAHKKILLEMLDRVNNELIRLRDEILIETDQDRRKQLIEAQTRIESLYNDLLFICAKKED